MNIRVFTKVAGLFALFFVAGCILVMRSDIIFTGPKYDREFMLLVRGEIQDRMEQSGGNCRFPDWGNELMICLSFEKISVSSGFTDEGLVWVQIDSSAALMLPPSAIRAARGDYTPAEIADWESWIINEFGYRGFDRKVRQFGDDLLTQEF